MLSAPQSLAPKPPPPFQQWIASTLARLWRLLGWIWGSIIVGGLLVGFVISYFFTGTFGISNLDPHTWFLMKPLFAHPLITILILVPALAITVCAYLANRHEQTKTQKKEEDYQDALVSIARRVEALHSPPPPQPTSTPEHVWNVPYRRNQFFTGREGILTKLHDTLKNGKVATLSQPQSINGLGGVGKTQCAVEYAYRHRDEYSHVLWANAASRELLITSFVELANLLELAECSEQEQVKIVEAVTRWLGSHPDWLLILDNADDLSMTLSFVPTLYTGHVLLTSRYQASGGLVDTLELREMDLQEGTTMLLRRAKKLTTKQELDQADPQERQQAEAIVKAMGGLPLALDQAGAYIEENHTTLQDYLAAFEQRQAELLTRRGENPIQHEDSVTLTFAISYKAVEQKNPLAAAILRTCAFLAPDDIPEELFKESAKELGPPFKSVTTNDTLLQESIGILWRYSLIRRDTKEHTLFIHRLVQAVIRTTMDEKEQKQQAEYLILALNSIFPDVNPTTWALCQRYLPHALVCTEHIEQWSIETPQAARLLNQTGYYLKARAQYTDAEPLYQRALHIHEQQLGPEHPDTAASLNNLAGLYRAQGKFEQAEPLLKRALLIREQRLGPQHPDTAQSLNNLALLYDDQGKYEQAEPLLKRALLIREQQLGPEHPDTAASFNSLAALYNDQGKYELAEPLLKRALLIREQQLGSQHPDTATSLNNLALLYYAQSKYEQAEPLLKRALFISEQQLGPEHPNTAQSLNNLAELYYAQSKYEQAEPLLKRALRIREQQLGSDHPDTAQSLNNLALLYYAQSKYEQAEPLLKRALHIYETRLGHDHPTTITLRANYAALREKMKDEYYC